MSSPPRKRIARGGEHFEHVSVQIEEGRVERAAAEVIDRDPLLGPLAEPVCERCGGRLVQDAKDLEPRDAPCDLRGRPLQLVEVGRDGDDRPLHALSERGLGELARPLQDERADLRERVLLAARDDERPLPRPLLHLEREALARLFELRAVPRPPEEALHAGDRVLRVDGPPRLGVVADEDLAVRVEADDARKEPPPLLVGQDVHTPVPDARDDGVRCAEVDSYDRHAGSGNITWGPARRKIPGHRHFRKRAGFRLPIPIPTAAPPGRRRTSDGWRSGRATSTRNRPT